MKFSSCSSSNNRTRLEEVVARLGDDADHGVVLAVLIELSIVC